MSTPRIAFRAIDPKAVQTEIEHGQEVRAAAIAAVEAFTDEHFPDTTASVFVRFDGSFSVTGFIREGAWFDNAREIPAGMRVDSKTRNLEPALRTAEGRAIGAQLKALRYTTSPVGGISGIFTGTVGEQGFICAPQFHVLTRKNGDTEVYMTFSVDTLRDRDDARVMATGAWKSVRRSAFYAALEEHEERTKVAQPTG